MNTINVTCKDVAEHICENLGEDLDSPRCKAIKQHLDGCQDCKDYFSSVNKTIEFYRVYNVELPADAHKRLMDCLGLPDEEK